MKIPKIRSIGVLTAIVVTSIVVPSAISSLESAVTPHFDPVAFGLPADAKEVVKKRTEKAVTFEVTPGKFASASTGDRLQSPSCDKATLSTLCQAVSLVRGIIPYAFATSQGPNSPGTLTTDGSGEKPWVNPGNASSSNDVYATTTLDYSFAPEHQEISDYLKATNFGFSIVSGATINGIVGEFERRGDTNVCDNSIKLIKGGTIQGDDKFSCLDDWPSSNHNSTDDAYASYGSNSDLWGLTWLYSDINASNFGFAISAVNDGPGNTNVGYIDHIRLTVYYTEVAGPAPFFSWWSLPLMLIGCAWVLWKEGYLGSDMIQERI